MSRKVEYFKYIRVNKDGKSFYEKISCGYAQFHQWGVGYEEYESGPGNYSTAIIELPDGSVKNINAENIKFVDIQ